MNTPPPDPRARLEVQGVGLTYGGVAALTAVDLRVDRSEVRGLIGPNGAGKTSLMDVISGVRRARTGRVLVDGHDLTRATATERARRGVARTFQRQQPFGWMTVRENLLAALDQRGGRRGSRSARVEMLLEACGLGDVREVMAGHLPLGRARMLELARALVGEPAVLLLDEPNSGLDPTDSARLTRVVRDYVNSHTAAVVVVEHDMHFVHELCTHVTVLALGQVIFDGAASDVHADDAVRAAFLGSPR